MLVFNSYNNLFLLFRFHEVATDLSVEDRIMMAIAGIRSIR